MQPSSPQGPEAFAITPVGGPVHPELADETSSAWPPTPGYPSQPHWAEGRWLVWEAGPAQAYSPEEWCWPSPLGTWPLGKGELESASMPSWWTLLPQGGGAW